MTYRICLIPGDGVGQEVIPAAAEVVRATGLAVDFVPADAGWGCFQRTGNALPDETVEAVRACGVALFGATQSPMTRVAGYRSPILAMRQAFDLYANIRPTHSLPVAGARSGLDFIIARENTEDLYAGRERLEGDTAVAERVITRYATERIVRAAADLTGRRAAQRGEGRGRLTLVHKANVLRLTDGLFRETARAVMADYPDVDVDELLVDAAAMWLVKAPERFDVLVTTNMFGDILSDLAAGLIGGLGVAPSANIGPHVAVFEPVHGSAPDIAGQGVANPVGAILSAAMLLDHIGESAAARRVRDAVDATLAAGVMTPDLGGAARTAEVTAAIVARIEGQEFRDRLANLSHLDDLTFDLTRNDERAEYVTDRLIEFNQAHTPRPPVPSEAALEHQPLHLFALDRDGQLVAGLVGHTHRVREWLEITVIWVSEARRGQGIGRALMTRAEEEGRARGCRYARLVTSDYQAPGFYARLGYTLYGQLANFPPGETDFFYHKDLA